MELGCVVFLFGVPIMIWMFIEYIREQSNRRNGRSKTPTSYPYLSKYDQKIKIAGRNDLTSWALHKHPEDIDAHDYRDFSVLDANVVIHKEGGVNKVVKGLEKGRILSDWEVDELKKED
jgi:hypothetical protein